MNDALNTAIFASIIFLIGFGTGIKFCDEHCKEMSVKAGCGEYNATTGKFQWEKLAKKRVNSE